VRSTLAGGARGPYCLPQDDARRDRAEARL